MLSRQICNVLTQNLKQGALSIKHTQGGFNAKYTSNYFRYILIQINYQIRKVFPKSLPLTFKFNQMLFNIFSTSLARKETFTIQDEEQFKTKIMAEGASPTIVDFSATWCGPCKLLTPR